jgi:surface antigen
MQKDAAYALLAVGVALGGGTIAKAALDDLLDPDKASARAAEKRALAMTPLDRTVKFGVMSIMIGGLAMRLYDWATTGKAPKISEIV